MLGILRESAREGQATSERFEKEGKNRGELEDTREMDWLTRTGQEDRTKDFGRPAVQASYRLENRERRIELPNTRSGSRQDKRIRKEAEKKIYFSPGLAAATAAAAAIRFLYGIAQRLRRCHANLFFWLTTPDTISHPLSVPVGERRGEGACETKMRRKRQIASLTPPSRDVFLLFQFNFGWLLAASRSGKFTLDTRGDIPIL